MWLVLGLLTIIGVGLLVLGGTGALSGIGTGAVISALVSLALIVWIGSSVAQAYEGRLPRALRDLAIWAGLAMVLVAGYSFREEFAFVGRRMAGELLPPGEAVVSEGSRAGETSVRIRRRGDGHFVAKVEVDGSGLTMLVDTGASAVVLSPTDARRIGINVDGLSFSVPINTANGTTYAAAVRLRRIGIGPIVMDGIEALVAKPGALNESLLGMTFLRRLRSYEFSGDFLTLRG